MNLRSHTLHFDGLAPSTKPQKCTSAVGRKARWWVPLAAVFAMLGLTPGVGHAEEAQPGWAETLDAQFGAWVVGPLAKVMFFDLMFWDNTLGEGELPSTDDGSPLLVGNEAVVGFTPGQGYQYREVRTVAVADVERVPAPDERVELPGSKLARVMEVDGKLIASVAPDTLPLAPCTVFAECGEPLPPADPGASGEWSLDGVTYLGVPADPTFARLLRDRGPAPVVVVQSVGDVMTRLGERFAVSRDVLDLREGRIVRLDGAEWTVRGQQDDQSLRVWSNSSRFDAQPLANPKNISIPVVVAWLVFGAVFFTLRMQFVNLRAFGHAIAVTMGKYDRPEDEGEISHFKALSSALSATVGLGNIAGVALAVAAGGPGAIPWMIIAGFLGMSSKFTECTLGQMYRSRDAAGNLSGGPMHYLYKGLAEQDRPGLGRGLAVVFALMCIGGSLGGGNMFQSNQAFVAVAGQVAFFADKAWLFGLLMAVVVAAVILGGIKRIGTTAGVIVPFMCGIYVIAAVYILLVNTERLPGAFQVMFEGAFSLKAGIGGLLGALIQGFRRAAFSNEAGVGSASIAHSAAATDEPVREGIVALLEPFIDTIVVCTMTGLVVVVTGAYQSGVGEGVEMTAIAFRSALPWFPTVLSIAVVLFAFSTMISWSYYGERCAVHLFGQAASTPYKVLFCVFSFLGAVMKLGNVLDFSDLMVLGMAFPNIVGLLFLSTKVRNALDDYMRRLGSGEMKPTV